MMASQKYVNIDHHGTSMGFNTGPLDERFCAVAAVPTIKVIENLHGER